MSAGFLRNGNRAHNFINHIWKKNSISDSIGAPNPIHRTRVNHHHHQLQHSKPFCSRFPQRKVKEMGFSVPVPSTTNPTTFVSSIAKTGFIGWYLGMIKTRPILTKSITSALIYTAADLSSQTMTRSSSEPYDLIRTCRMAGYGMIILGPSLHYWFNFVSKILPKRDLVTTFKKMFLGQAVYGPTMTVVFFSVNAGLQGESGAEIISRLKRDLFPTMINGAMYWPVCDFITFRFIPVHLQPLVSNSFAYLWTVYITYMASLEKAGAKQ